MISNRIAIVTMLAALALIVYCAEIGLLAPLFR